MVKVMIILFRNNIA